MTDASSEALLPSVEAEARARQRSYVLFSAAARSAEHHGARPRSRRRHSRRVPGGWRHFLLVIVITGTVIAVAIMYNVGRMREVESSPIVQGDDELVGFVVSTSAYAWGCGASGPTRAGTPVRWGVVATDPSVIPLGTELEIEGFSGTTFIAEDTGSAVIGSKVDIYWPDGCASALGYGRQTRMLRFV
jgi:3D (Asp-Asp-Asp) domain-containing protein